MEKVALIVFGMIVVQGLFTFLQVKNFNKKLTELKQYGMVGVGMKKGRLNVGNIILIAVDSQGTIVRCEKMQGITVFARFREVKNMVGVPLSVLKEDVVRNLKYNKRGFAKPDAMLQAIERIEDRLAA